MTLFYLRLDRPNHKRRDATPVLHRAPPWVVFTLEAPIEPLDSSFYLLDVLLCEVCQRRVNIRYGELQGGACIQKLLRNCSVRVEHSVTCQIIIIRQIAFSGIFTILDCNNYVDDLLDDV